MNVYLKIITLIVASSFLSSCFHDNDSQPLEKVFKSDGSVQCGDSGIELEVMAQELINNGIDVICSQKGNDGMVYPAVCGAGTGSINIYTIHRANLPDAELLGFASVDILSEYRDQQCVFP